MRHPLEASSAGQSERSEDRHSQRHRRVPPAAIRAMHSVEGRVVIVTGSGQGVGRGMAHHFAKAGATVVVADWNAEKMARTVAELQDLGAEALGVQCNIMERETLDAMVAAAVEEYGRVDAIVNNAQTFRPNAPIAEVSADDLDVFYLSLIHI